MPKAMRYDGKNACAICAWATGKELKPYELAGGFWMKQLLDGDFVNGKVVGYQLAAPARSGEVYLDEGDFFVREDDDEFVRLSPEQMKLEHPLLLAALER